MAISGTAVSPIAVGSVASCGTGSFAVATVCGAVAVFAAAAAVVVVVDDDDVVADVAPSTGVVVRTSAISDC